MNIIQDFIRNNNRIKIISNNGQPTVIPKSWRPILGNADMLVAIPDMHMYIYSSNLDNFKYGAAAMLDLQNHLLDLKDEMTSDNKVLRIYQTGDLFEQRYPGISNPGSNATAAEIRMSFPDYEKIVNNFTFLRTHYIYGNHDFELRHFPSFQFAALEGKVYLEHGFSPDTWCYFDNPNAPLWEESQIVFLGIREINEFFGNLLVSVGIISKDNCFAVGVRSGKTPDNKMPGASKYIKDYQKQLEYYPKRIANVPGARVCIIGHTHYPYLDPNANNGNSIYVDAGAWTEGRSDFVVVTDEELAICTQLRP